MSRVASRPRLIEEDVRALLREHYGLDARIRGLEGECDQTLLAETDSGERYILKIAHPSEPERHKRV